MVYVETSKNEDTWCKMLGHYLCRIRYSPESIQGTVDWKTFCTLVRNCDSNLNVPYVYDNGDEVVVNWNWLDNDWNDNNPAARFAILSFLSLLRVGRVLFLNLTIPASKHLSNLISFYRKSNIFLIIQRLCLPENH